MVEMCTEYDGIVMFDAMWGQKMKKVRKSKFRTLIYEIGFLDQYINIKYRRSIVEVGLNVLRINSTSAIYLHF
jgi:hypothetical protein